MINDKKIPFNNKIIIIGFGSIGQALLPLLFQALDIQPSQISIIASDDSGVKVAQQFQVHFQLNTITSKNYFDAIGNQLQPNDFVVNLALNISSAAMIELCNEKGALYMDTSIEPWGEHFIVDQLSLAHRTNYMLRENLLKLKSNVEKTAVVAHGANPGLASHFVKQALLNMAKDNGLTVNVPQSSLEWSNLAATLGIKVIHVSERDTQVSNQAKASGEFVNTWSVDALVEEGLQPAELGWGTHEAHWPSDAYNHDTGSRCSIYLGRPGAGTRVRSWAPALGAFHGFLITHPETTSIANFLTLTNGSTVEYRPTVHYAYSPCPDAILSIFEMGSTEWTPQKNKRIMLNEIVDGQDELGVLLMGNKRGAYWFGSTLSIHHARNLLPHNNATTLQVVAGVLSGMLWAIEHPNEGLVEAEDIDHEYVMNIALPYLGEVAGYYTDWTPLKNRDVLFSEQLDLNDPWQFVNIRVS